MTFDDKKYKIYTWKNVYVLHWTLNPGVAILELLYGIRAPKITLELKGSDLPKFEKTYVPCPHCHMLHDSRTWSAPNKTGKRNWFGLFCPNCEDIIPCHMNVFTFLLLAITYPIWGWFKDGMKSRWLAAQKPRFENFKFEPTKNPYDNHEWIKQGMSWALFMFITMQIALPLIQGQEITKVDLLIGCIIWSLGGLGFGYTMKAYFNYMMKQKIFK